MVFATNCTFSMTLKPFYDLLRFPKSNTPKIIKIFLICLCESKNYNLILNTFTNILFVSLADFSSI